MSLASPLLAGTGYQTYLAAMLLGFGIGVIGHVMRSTAVIALGILVIGGTSVALLAAVSTS